MAIKTQILFLSANPKEEDDTSFNDAFKDIQKKIINTKNREKFDLESAHKISVNELQDLMLGTYTPQIVHFYGHATSSFLELEDEHQRVQQTKLRPFANMFKLLNENQEDEKKKIRCVVLVACSSKQIAKAVSKYVDCTIGMRSPIGVDTGREFAKSFYYNICNGKSVKFAFDAACISIDFKNLDEQNKPQLLVRDGCDANKIFFPYKIVDKSILCEEDIAEIGHFIDTFLDLDWDQALPKIQECWNLAPSEFKGQDLKKIQCILQALGNYFESQRFILQEANFIQAKEQLEKIPKDIDKIGGKKLQEISTAFLLYYSAIIEFQKRNVNQALVLFAEAKKYLQNIGQFVKKYQFFINTMEPEMLFASAVNALQEYDFLTAKMLTEQASNSSKKLAEDYFDEDEQIYNKFIGLSSFYLAFFKYQKAMIDFSMFNYEEVISDQSLTDDANNTIKILKKSNIDDLAVKNTLYVSEVLLNLSMAVQELSKILKASFVSDFHPKADDLLNIRQKINNANTAILKVGQQALPMVRYITQLSAQVDNIKKLVGHH